MDKIDCSVLNRFVGEILNPIEADFMIVGSTALYILGITENTPKDIDLEVKLKSNDDRNIFKALALQSGNEFFKKAATDVEYGMDNVTWVNKPYIFNWGGEVFNIWIVEDFSHKSIQLNTGYLVAEAMSVIKKKMAYKREKDRVFMKDLIAKLIELI